MDMERTSDLHPHPARPGFLAEVTLDLLYIRDTRATGRISIRNAERFGLAHLYFNAARLIHITGDKPAGEVILNDLLTWSRGSVRFDAALLVNYETVTWQQAQIFARWLAFLEMGGVMHGIPRARLDGFVHSFTESLPMQPIALPEEIEYYDKHEEVALARQWQRLNEGVQHLIERTVAEEQRQQLKQVSQRVNGVVQQAGDVTQELAKRAFKATQEGVRHAAGAAQEAARQRALQAEELVRGTFNEDRRQQIIQSVQDTVESVKQTVSQSVGQRLEAELSERTSPLPPELQAKSVRPMRSFQSPASAAGGLGEGQ
jgi:hypothetical protein